MAITKKPVQEKEIKELIEKGGSVAFASSENQELMRLQLRLPAGVVAEIDDLLSSRLVKPSRHTWFLEAIYEKMEREKQDVGLQ